MEEFCEKFPKVYNIIKRLFFELWVKLNYQIFRETFEFNKNSWFTPTPYTLHPTPYISYYLDPNDFNIENT